MNRLNWSTLKHIEISPALMRWRVDHPQADTPALKLGRAIHCLILDPGEFAKRFVAAGACAAIKKTTGEMCGSGGSLFLAGSWFCKVKGHAPSDAKVPSEFDTLEESEFQLAGVCAEAVMRHRVARETLTGGKAEQELEWEFDGVACRGRLDYLRSYVADLKSTRTETPREFFRDAAENLYHGQLAWYHDGAVAAGRIAKDSTPRIISVSTVEPFDVGVYECDDGVLAAGRSLYRRLLTRYQECLASDWWPGHTPDLSYVDLPEWAEGVREAISRGDY